MDKPLSEAVGSYLKTLRQIKGLSQEAVGRILNVSSKQVSNWERGIHVPAAQALGMLFQSVGGSFQDIFELLSNAHSTVDDGQLLAERWLSTRHVLSHRLDKTKDAIGAYLTVFLDSLNQTPDQIAGSLQIPLDQLEQIKSGKLPLSESLIGVLVSELQVPFADLAFLLSALNPTAEEGARRAKVAIGSVASDQPPSASQDLQSPVSNPGPQEPLFSPAEPSGQPDDVYAAYAEAIQAINDIYQAKPQELPRIVDILGVLRK
jgi:transcriptional regulator with XRE-family HTH domain